ncbi:MAG: hypothetical protein J3K34DRAFT_524352 [Monoraphidium minutum]|nr:MAG: hypothetical protein J3K34DRAFT_524352 [Monoraphidium minutum]
MWVVLAYGLRSLYCLSMWCHRGQTTGRDRTGQGVVGSGGPFPSLKHRRILHCHGCTGHPLGGAVASSPGGDKGGREGRSAVAAAVCGGGRCGVAGAAGGSCPAARPLQIGPSPLLLLLLLLLPGWAPHELGVLLNLWQHSGHRRSRRA